MQVNFRTNNYTPNFKARFSREDIKTLMKSAEKETEFMQDVMAISVANKTGKPVENIKAELDSNTKYRSLNAILTHADKVKGKALKLIKEDTYKILNDYNEILGVGKEPMQALRNAFILRSKYELAPKYWGHRIPNRILEEIIQKQDFVTEEDVLSKSL